MRSPSPSAPLSKPFVRYWMHNGTVMVGGEKMSKSKGNFKTVGEEATRSGRHSCASAC